MTCMQHVVEGRKYLLTYGTEQDFTEEAHSAVSETFKSLEERFFDKRVESPSLTDIEEEIAGLLASFNNTSSAIPKIHNKYSDEVADLIARVV